MFHNNESTPAFCMEWNAPKYLTNHPAYDCVQIDGNNGDRFLTDAVCTTAYDSSLSSGGQICEFLAGV